MRPSDELEDDALEALLVLAFLEDPPPDPGAEIPAPPLGDFDGLAAVQEDGPSRRVLSHQAA